eukprot:TRINITY_DN9594_c0_g2_i1.p1 TRINITY_DN9594_c0_g2~~TRINITY_DN9594_c0_g2_i1.p1  ORF type:complete len:883 (+),score=159.28 TRINITY_DN9594_c0_g2_i1:89-2737(+)
MSLRTALDGFFKPKNRYSLENFQYVVSQLQRNIVATSATHALVIENLRTMTEIIVWGDRNDQRVIDTFLEKSVMGIILEILKLNSEKSIKLQVLQTVAMLIENIRSENCTFYIMSNNRLNEVIMHKFDLSDEETLALYVTLLKNTSIRLNLDSLQFLFNPDRDYPFPIYHEAVRLFNHPESMVRTAVRTLTLSIFKVDDEDMRAFLIHSRTAIYFLNLIWFLRNLHVKIDNNMCQERIVNVGRCKDLFAELVDVIYYLNDVIEVDVPGFNATLTDYLLEYFLMSMIVPSVKQAAFATKAYATPAGSPSLTSLARSRVSSLIQPQDADSASPKPSLSTMRVEFANPKVTLSPLVTITGLIQIFSLLQSPDTLNALTVSLFYPREPQISTEIPPTQCDPNYRHPRFSAKRLYFSHDQAGQPPNVYHNPYTKALLDYLLSPDQRISYSALILLYAIITNKHIHPRVLKACNLASQKTIHPIKMMNTSHRRSVQLAKVGYLSKRRSMSGLDWSSIENIQSTNRIFMDFDTGTTSEIGPPASRHVYHAYIRDTAARDPLVFVGLCEDILNPKEEHDGADFYARQITSSIIRLMSESDSPKVMVVVDALLQELLCHPERPIVQLEKADLDMIDATLQNSIKLLQVFNSSTLGQVIVEVFEQEYKQIKPFNFPQVAGNIQTYVATQDLRKGPADLSWSALSKSEMLRSAIQNYIIQRKIKLMCSQEKDDIFPFPGSVPPYKIGDSIDTSGMQVYGCTATGSDQKKIVRHIVTHPTHLILADPDYTRAGLATVKWIYPYDQILCHCDPNRPRELQLKYYSYNPILFAHIPETVQSGWSLSLSFSSNETAMKVSHEVWELKNDLKAQKSTHFSKALLPLEHQFPQKKHILS